ncbi:MAG: hypothetical protein HQM10_08030 [Candidatus Riflebacteria bacterium]|nr:hypothetical protein [Candidatus Riflebacteria bacterium]
MNITESNDKMEHSERNSRSGVGFFILIALSAIFGIMIVMMLSVHSNQVHWMTKNEKDFFSNTVAEAALNVALGELQINPSFRTHYKFAGTASKTRTWEAPVKSAYPMFSKAGDLALSGISNGIYSGQTRNGMFKFKLAPIFGSRENSKTKSLKEASMFAKCEVVACVGSHGNEKEDSYRRITAILEKRCPLYEYLLFDGEMLDLGYGPYNNPNELKGARLYGYQWITFNTTGGRDQGSDIKAAEKIETPGMIRSMRETRVDFVDNTYAKLSPSNDSGKPDKFQSYSGYILDGNTGGKPYKAAYLSKETYLKKVTYLSKYKKGGFIVENDTFEESKWRNPYDPQNPYFEINFGEPNYRQNASSSSEADDEGESAPNEEDEDENSPKKEKSMNANDPPMGGDDGGLNSELARTRGAKMLIYSKVPLRIWGCPDRTTTIFCEKDVVICGDFNHTENTIQDYQTADFLDYKTALKNGRAGKDRVYNKVGAAIISLGRIIIDYSRPTLFAKNEIRPYFFYQFGMSLGPNDAGEKYLLEQVCPVDPYNLKEINGGGSLDPSGSMATFKVINDFNQYSDTFQASSPYYVDKLASLTDFLTPINDGRPHFGIQDEKTRKEFIYEVITHIKNGAGTVKPESLKEIFDFAWNAAMEEEQNSPNENSGAMGVMNGLFDAAVKFTKDEKNRVGIRPPEITINAALVSCVRRSSPWKIGSSNQKVFEEIGNVACENPKMIEYIKSPRFIIQRVFGSEIRLASEEPEYFFNGSYTGKALVRRRIWDKSLAGGKYQPPALFYTHGILSVRDELITRKDFDSF